LAEVRQLEDYPAQTQAFLRFLARETGHTVDTVLSWQRRGGGQSVPQKEKRAPEARP
jgi:hypothetical protein